MNYTNSLRYTGRLLIISLLCLTAPLVSMADAASPYVANWALIIPGGSAGWLGINRQKDGSLKASMLWGGGSPFELTNLKLRENKIVMARVKKNRKTKKNITEIFEAVIAGPFIKIERKILNHKGTIIKQDKFNGKRISMHKPAPDVSTLEFGEPLELIKGDELTGWKPINKSAPNCWSIKDGILSNRVKGPDGKDRNGTNLRTERLFNDFKLTTDVRVPEHGNSGIYLRGIYEIQVSESFGKPVNCHNMGALYGRITPSESAEKPADEWQTFEIILCDRYITVILNGKKIIDNQPAMGCTGGALTSDEFSPGPIYLQGDHTDVDYRNMILTPIIKY